MLRALVILLIVTPSLAAAPKRKPLELTFWRSMLVVEPLKEERLAIRDVPWQLGGVPRAATDAGVVSEPWTTAWERPFAREAEFGVQLSELNGKLFSMGSQGCALIQPDGGLALSPMPRLPSTGRVFADPARDRIYVSGDGVTELSGGVTRFLQPLPGFSASLVISGERLLAWGGLAGQHPHGGPLKREVALSVLDLKNSSGPVPKITLNGVSDVAVAASSATIALALPGELHFLEWDLAKGRALTAPEPFVPLSVSLDDSRRVWMVVALEKGVELWVVEAEGVRRVRSPLPLVRADGTPDTWAAGDVFFASPPQFDQEHRVYVQAGRRLPTGGVDGVLVAFSKTGKLAWNRPLAGNGGALVVTDHVLVTDRDSLSSVDPFGAETLLFRASEPFVAAPVVLSPDAIALATAKKVLLVRRLSEPKAAPRSE